MTEAEWLNLTSSYSIPVFIRLGLGLSRTKNGRRKLRLYACACCRRAWHLLDERSRQAVEVAERFAEGTASKAELERVWQRVRAAVPCGAVCNRISSTAEQAPGEAAAVLARAAEAQQEGSFPEVFKAEERVQAALIRDIFGNPFRPIAFSPEWRTDTAVTLASRMYESCDFSAMPILADALQDAGCDNDDILNHCRGEAPHVRGCWVVDLVLGKS